MVKYPIIIEQDETGVLVGSVAELPGCHSQAETCDELFSRMKEAIELYLEVEQET
ncbi:MAG: type II toxin-antitoxin system HicB family antitoxin [bacterium]|nr:type II toxin-antitoxin system HicB family antitoxin [bacterium]